MTLTPSDLSRLEELARAATPGKRTATPCAHDPECCDYLRFEDGTDLLKTDSGTYPPEMPDALFIAACDRETILELVAEVRRLREQPKNVLSADAVEWVVNSLAELGVKIGDQFFFLYKGESLVYHEDDSDEFGAPLQWRHVGKREFGECCHPINDADPTRYGTVSTNDGRTWEPLPLTPRQPEEP